MVDGSETEAFVRDALAGLTAPTKTLPGKYLWDDAGSDLFDRICAHPDYYPTGHEMTLLPEVAADVAPIVGAGAGVVEFGAGASRKIRVLLDALAAPKAYVALDISGDYLAAAIARLAPDYPGVTMTPVAADYSKPIRLPEGVAGDNRLGFFAGTSIGNFSPDDAAGFLARARDTLGPSRFLVGADPTRDPERLKRAYGACDGLMPALHLNLLARMNRELGADFALDNFRHEARVVDEPFRVEAHLVAQRPAIYRLGGEEIRFAPGESIRTDTSHKYTPAAFRALAERGGWTPERMWLDQTGAFSLHLLRA